MIISDDVDMKQFEIKQEIDRKRTQEEVNDATSPLRGIESVHQMQSTVESSIKSRSINIPLNNSETFQSENSKAFACEIRRCRRTVQLLRKRMESDGV